MTPEEQRIAIAEVCGWHHGNWNDQPVDESFWTHDDIEMRRRLGVPSGCLPDYLNDLNAMHEAEKVLTATQQEQYWLRLVDAIWLPVLAEYPDANFSQENIKITLLFATAAQRAEAFLRTWNNELPDVQLTLNLWKD